MLSVCWRRCHQYAGAEAARTAASAHIRAVGSLGEDGFDNDLTAGMLSLQDGCIPFELLPCSSEKRKKTRY